jgi:hypothetical protein
LYVCGFYMCMWVLYVFVGFICGCGFNMCMWVFMGVFGLACGLICSPGHLQEVLPVPEVSQIRHGRQRVREVQQVREVEAVRFVCGFRMWVYMLMWVSVCGFG